ncbi:MAG TPA: DUF3365 domain-containing protein [Longimicrobiales bacterium]|nr:DUF3365 domain-containing protein [Longimicrobiales bacterium]
MLITAGMGLLAACGSDAGSRDTPDTARLLAAEDSAYAVEQGGAIAGAIATGLVQRLQAELATGGAAGAVDFCARTALTLTDSLVADQPAGTAVRRTSTRIRNPSNAPDDLESVALAWFDSVHAATGAIPQSLVQDAGPEEVRFYRPLVVQPFCTQCHGPVDELAPGVQAILEQRYPDDHATGYRDGDLRGVIRVSLPRR